MALSAIDRMEILDTMARYYHAIDEFYSLGKSQNHAEQLDRVAAFYAEDFLWELFLYGSSEPLVQVRSREDVERLRAHVATNDVLERHHVSSVAFSEVEPDVISTEARVLVTRQQLDSRPQINGVSLCTTVWRKAGQRWKIARYSIHRDPIPKGLDD